MTTDLGPAAALIEREDEVRRLETLLGAAISGRGAQVPLIGAAGVGKTTLLNGFADHARLRGARVLLASAGQLEAQTPFGLVRRLLARDVRRLSEEQRASVGGGPGQTATDFLLGAEHVPVEQGDMVISLGWLLDGLAALGPVVIAVDDAQWADEESLVFLASLREQVRDLPVLVVVAARDVVAAERGPALAALVADHETDVLRPDTLSREGVRELLARTWGGEVAPAMAAAAHDVSGGNPFLVTALARLLRETDPSERTVDRLHAEVPGSIVDSVIQRVAVLPASDGALLRAVATLESAQLVDAAWLADLGLDDAGAGADRLRAAGLLDPGTRLTFRHGLLRSAAYASIPTDLRESLHRKAARHFADSEPDTAVAHLVATHGVGDPWAVEALREAARRASDTGAPQSAVALLRRAASEPPTAQERPRLLVELGLAEMRTLDPTCVTTLEEARSCVLSVADRAEVALALAGAYSYAGFHDVAAGVLADALTAISGQDTERELEVEAALIGTGMLVPSRMDEARRRVAARPGLSGATRGERLFLIQAMSVASAQGEPVSVLLGYADQVIGPWETIDQSPESTDWVWPRLFLAASGYTDRVRELTSAGFARAERNGSTIGFLTASFVAGANELWGGDQDEAEAHFRTMLERGRTLNGGVLVETLAGGGLAQSLAVQGRTVEALEVLAPFPEEFPADAPINGVGMLAFGRAVARQYAGDHAGALASARYIGRLLVELKCDSPTWVAWRAPAVRALWSLGEVDEARAVADLHLEMCERSAVVPLLAEALGLAALVDADLAGALRLADRGVEVASQGSSRSVEAQVRLNYGTLLRRAGQRAAARDQLQVARALALEVSAGAIAAEAEDELAAAGARARRVAVVGVASLTAAELRVCELALSGLRNRDIAQKLFVTPKTVEVHLSRAYRKLGITGRDQLGPALKG